VDVRFIAYNKNPDNNTCVCSCSHGQASDDSGGDDDDDEEEEWDDEEEGGGSDTNDDQSQDDQLPDGVTWVDYQACVLRLNPFPLHFYASCGHVLGVDVASPSCKPFPSLLFPVMLAQVRA
jgi:hypothetical protein